MRIATWNLQWASPGRDRHRRALDHLSGLDADIVVTTEDSLHDWPEYPHRLDAGNDWGYQTTARRRKVIAWSRTAWTDPVELATPAASGRFVQGTTSIDGTPVRLLAVCIPYADAHVATGRKDRRKWAEHLEFCDALGPAISSAGALGPTVVAGDFNQRIPRTRQPRAVADVLDRTFVSMRIPTAGEFPVGRLIDHIAVSGGFEVLDVNAWSNVIDGRRVSDHSGVAVTLGMA